MKFDFTIDHKKLVGALPIKATCWNEVSDCYALLENARSMQLVDEAVRLTVNCIGSAIIDPVSYDFQKIGRVGPDVLNDVITVTHLAAYALEVLHLSIHAVRGDLKAQNTTLRNLHRLQTGLILLLGMSGRKRGGEGWDAHVSNVLTVVQNYGYF